MKSFEERAAERKAEFDRDAKTIRRIAVAVGVLLAVGALVILGLATYVVLNLV